MEMILKSLVLTRHGEYQTSTTISGGLLSDKGKKNVRKLANELCLAFRNRKIAVLSSSAGRALQTAEIIAEKLGIAFEQYDELWSEENKPPNYESLWKILSSYEEYNIIIVVTHFEYLDGFPRFFARKFPNVFQTRYWRSVSIGYAEALHLDLECGMRKKTNPFGHSFFID